jgi:hypothetical protein
VLSFIVIAPLPVPRELLTAGIVLGGGIEIERQLRMEKRKAKLLSMAAEGKFEQAIDSVVTTRLAMERDADRMGWRILKANRYRFGRSTERLSREEIKEEARSSPSDEGCERRRTRCQKSGCAGQRATLQHFLVQKRVSQEFERESVGLYVIRTLPSRPRCTRVNPRLQGYPSTLPTHVGLDHFCR